MLGGLAGGSAADVFAAAPTSATDPASHTACTWLAHLDRILAERMIASHRGSECWLDPKLVAQRPPFKRRSVATLAKATSRQRIGAEPSSFAPLHPEPCVLPMKAAFIQQPGPPESITFGDLPKPS